MTTQEILSKRLVEVRKNNGYTRRRLAEELNRPYRTITNYETGEHEPGHKYLIEIAKKFGVTTDYLLGLSDDPQKTADGEKKAPSTADKNDITLAEDEWQLIENYRSLNNQGQEYVRQTMYMATQIYKKMPDLSSVEKQA